MWGIIAITETGLSLAKKLKEQFPESVIYTLQKWRDAETEVIEGELGIFTGELFKRHHTLVYIMATGIVVRCIAHHITTKTTDPAIVVMDERGQFAISLLSGHLGGANAVASAIAEKLHATPVITTASDVQGVPSVDMIAKAHHLVIASMEDAKTITAMTVNGAKISLRNDSNVPLPPCFPLDEEKAEGLVIVSNRQMTEVNLPYTQLIPQNITIGVGCKRGIPGSNIIAFILQKLRACNIHPMSIHQLASVDIKSEEVGILEAAQYFGVKAVFIPTAEIEAIESHFSSSAFVKSQIGVSGVCEPAAFIAGGREGQFVSKKQSNEGITVAVFESVR